jgi:DNA-binding NtrC family response regulator
VIERALILEDEDLITLKYLPPSLTQADKQSAGAVSEGQAGNNHNVRLPPGGLSLDKVEMSLVQQAINQSGGNQTKAAELLGISRDQLRYRLKKIEEAAG